MQIVMVESPFSSPICPRARCVLYAQWCVMDAIDRGECPFASHLLYTHVLPEDRESRERGLAFRDRIATATGALVAIYTDLGETPGMIRPADTERGAFVERRTLSRGALVDFFSGLRPRATLSLEVNG